MPRKFHGWRSQTHEVTFHWVKGHAENEYNNRCDAMAVAEREKYA